MIIISVLLRHEEVQQKIRRIHFSATHEATLHIAVRRTWNKLLLSLSKRRWSITLETISRQLRTHSHSTLAFSLTLLTLATFTYSTTLLPNLKSSCWIRLGRISICKNILFCVTTFLQISGNTWHFLHADMTERQLNDLLDSATIILSPGSFLKTYTSFFPIYLFRLRNDLYCVGWGVKLYQLNLSTCSHICYYAFTHWRQCSCVHFLSAICYH